jgi:hypothetical protein
VEDIRIAVLIDEYNMGQRQVQAHLAGRITQALSRARLNIVKDLPESDRMSFFNIGDGAGTLKQLGYLAGVADIVIFGEVRSSLMDGNYSSTLVFSRARALVTIVDLVKNAELGRVDISTKGAGPSREEAGRRTIRKVSDKASDAVTLEVKRALLGQ